MLKYVSILVPLSQSSSVLEPNEEAALWSMSSGQEHQACQPLKSTLGAPQDPHKRVIFLFLLILSLSNKHTLPNGPILCSQDHAGRCVAISHGVETCPTLNDANGKITVKKYQWDISTDNRKLIN